MQVFKLFFKIAKSKLPSGLIYIIVFFAICFPLVKVATKEFNFEDTSIDITIYDEDNTAESKSLIDSIAKNNTIKELKKDSQVILDAMYYEQVDYCLTIKKGYAEKLAKTDVADMKDSLFETYHLHDSYATAMMQQYLDEYVRMTRSFIKSGNDLSEAIKKTEEKISIQTDISFAEFDSGDVKDENYGEGIASVFRYLPYLLISVLLNVLSPVLLVLKKKDQRYRMNCSSLPSSKYIVQIFAGSALIVLGIWLIFMIGGTIINGGMFTGTNAYIAILNSFIFALIAATIAILVASFNPAENTVSIITQIIGLGMCFLCGVFVPQSMLGDGVLSAARFLPAYWYERANDMLSGAQSGSMGDIWTSILVELAFLGVLVLVTIVFSVRPGSDARKRASKTVSV